MQEVVTDVDVTTTVLVVVIVTALALEVPHGALLSEKTIALAVAVQLPRLRLLVSPV